jgi:uncharacterized repeat protein (TIGR03803 family)
VPKIRLIALFSILGFVVTAAIASAAPTETVLYSFCAADHCKDGVYPLASLLGDAAGNLYGTTEMGGTHTFGTVFKLTPGTNGTWVHPLRQRDPRRYRETLAKAATEPARKGT